MNTYRLPTARVDQIEPISTSKTDQIILSRLGAHQWNTNKSTAQIDTYLDNRIYRTSRKRNLCDLEI